eukprot:COSAG01_NODE_1342_length_10639_cov_81.961206_6_plen_212_part_00
MALHCTALAPQHGLRRAGARTESRDVTLRELCHLHVAIEEARIEVLRGRNHSSPPRGVVVMPSDSIERLHKGTGPRQIISPATAAAGSSVWLHNDLMALTAGGSNASRKSVRNPFMMPPLVTSGPIIQGDAGVPRPSLPLPQSAHIRGFHDVPSAQQRRYVRIQAAEQLEQVAKACGDASGGLDHWLVGQVWLISYARISNTRPAEHGRCE